jgi:hypothetical protein
MGRGVVSGAALYISTYHNWYLSFIFPLIQHSCTLL